MTDSGGLAGGPARQPNVLFVLGDDWGWGDLGCFGHQKIATPNLDRLAAEGTRFTQFYVGAPVCSPSRAAFLTGRFPARCGFHHITTHDVERNRSRGVPDYLSLEYLTVSDRLRQAGYRTGHIGKWHLGSTPDAPDPGAYGFDVHRSVNSSSSDLRDGWLAKTAARSDAAVGTVDAAFRPYSTETIVDEAINFLRDGDRGTPFYLQVWLQDPHATLNPTDEQLEPYRSLMPPDVDHQGALAIYYSVITEADRQLGRLFGKLEELGLADNTLVLFTGDNGPEDLHVPNASHSAAGSSGPFRGRKRSLYEGGVRMPLIARWPKRVPAGEVNNLSVVAGVDLMATASSLAGVEAPESDGVDITPALLGRPFERDRDLYWEFRFENGSHPIHRSPAIAVRAGDWKLLTNPNGSRTELYRIPEDPMELTNLASERPDVVDDLVARAHTWASTLPAGPRSPLEGSNAYPWPTAAR